jgi:7-keto-8-aminopelargonate synthetase-like enzyme
MNCEPRTSLDFRLFDPLGYVDQPLPAAKFAMEATMDFYGFGACGPRGFYGGTVPHFELETALRHFLGTESAISYSAGVVTASSVIPALVQQGDRVIVDAEVHLGIRTGLRLCRGEIIWTPHGDVAAVEAALSGGGAAEDAPARGAKPKRGRTFIVMEGLYQRTGSIAPLAELVKLKEKHGALLILDETLSFGTLGTHGRGLTEHTGVDVGSVDAIIGSLEHAVASVGGFCAGHRGLVEHQRLAGAGYCFSASCPPAACSAAKAMLEDLAGESGAERIARMDSNAKLLHQMLQQAVYTSGAPLELISSPDSYVQHLRWAGQQKDENGEARLLHYAECCEEAAGGAVRVQVNSPAICGAEAAFGRRIKAPQEAKPSLRFCASAQHTAADMETVRAALLSAFRIEFGGR